MTRSRQHPSAQKRKLSQISASQTVVSRQLGQRTNRLLDRAINAAGEGICITGPNEAGNPLVYVNHGFEQLTGYPAAEVLGQNMRFLQGPDTDRAAVDQMRAAIESEQEFTTELLNYRKDGTPFWNQISITPVKDAAGKVSHFVAILHDLTDRKRVDEALRDSEVRYRRLFEAAKDGILILDAETGMVMDVNPFLVKMLGFSREQFLARGSGTWGSSRILSPIRPTSRNCRSRIHPLRR